MPEWVLWAPAMALGLVPALVVSRTRLRDERRWLLLAAAFGVSFVADGAGLVGDERMVSQAYPLSQGALFAFALAPAPVAWLVTLALALVSFVSLSWRGAAGLDLLLHIAAWGSTAELARRYLADGALRWTLMLGFVALAWAWALFRLDPSFPAWGTMQGVRLLIALGFAYAVREASRDVA